MVRRALSALLAWPLAVGCAHLGEEEKGPDLTIAASQTKTFAKAQATAKSGVAAYQHGGRSEKAEWLACKGAGAKGAVVLAHSERAGYGAARFCETWIAQAFLAQGLDVVAVNRPGYGASTGRPDFFGARSMAAMKAGVAAATKEAALAPTRGVWGYATGAAAAAQFSRGQGLQWLLVGGGVYDLEETAKSTSDAAMRRWIEGIGKTGGERALEDRSVGYDLSGLPPKVVVYHGRLDEVAPLKQAQAFADSLQSTGAQLTWQPLEGVGHDMPWHQHRAVLEVLARSVQ